MWVTVAVGILASLALLAVGRGIDDGRDRLRDDAARVAATSALRAQFESVDGQVRDISGLFQSSRRVERHEYREFARPMLRRSGASALVYLSLVEGDERARFERTHGRVIRERAPDRSLRPAGMRDRYLVVTLAEFDTPGIDIDGLDILPLPDRARTLGRVEATGLVSATRSIMLASDGREGLALFAPVHRDGRLVGVISGAFNHTVLAAGVYRAVNRRVGLRVATGEAVLGARGALPAGAARSRLAYGGQTFDVAVTGSAPACGSARSRSASACCSTTSSR